MTVPEVAARATRDTVAASIRRAVLVGVAVWQAVMVVAVVVVDTRLPAVPLVAAHIGVAVLVWSSLRDSRFFPVAVVAAYVLWFVDYRAAASLDDALTLAACWFGNLLYGLGALGMRGWSRVVVPVGAAVVVAVGLDLSDPLWDIQVTSTYVVTAIAICAAGVLGLPALWRIADEVDASATVLAERRTEAAVADQASKEAAEDARLVHDTIINTLGAVANGGRGTSDPALVQTRCARDLGVVEALLEGRRASLGQGLDSIGTDVEVLVVRREGLRGDELARVEERLDADVAAAVVAAAREAVSNAARHAGVEEVTVRVEVDDRGVVVTVVDDGVGMDDALPGTGLGLPESIGARMRAVGGRAAIDSRPGVGTTVRLEAPTEPVDPLESTDAVGSSVDRIVDSVLRRAAWLWAVGVLAVGIVIEAVNRPGELTATYGMLAVVAVGAAASWWSLSRHGRLVPAVTALLVVSLPSGFLLAMAGVGFGTVGVLYFQAIGITPLSTLLLVGGSRIGHRLALAALVGTAFVAAAVVGVQDAGRGAVVLVGLAPAVGLAAGWIGFARIVRSLVTDSEHNRALAVDAAARSSAQREVVLARRRWSTAGLERAGSLLRILAEDGTVAVDPAVQASCAEEEQHLRQLLLLSATAPRMSPWFAQALQRARERDVSLAVRSGDVDAQDLATARDVGRLVLRAVESSGAGTRVTVGFYPVAGGQELVLVLAPGGAKDLLASAQRLAGATCRTTSLDEADVLEVTVPWRDGDLSTALAT